MRKTKLFLSLALAALLLISCAACAQNTTPPVSSGSNLTPAETTPAETPAGNGDADFSSGGYTLTVPQEIKDLVAVDTQNLEGGMLFSVSEIASVEAAEKNGYGADSGLGWLCGVAKVTTDELHELLCGDMSGRDVFAQDEDGNFFLLCRPTDVRIEREGQITDADMQQWSKLNAWVTDVLPTDFINSNGGLYRAWRGNSELEIYLNRIAWTDVNYYLTSLDKGQVDPTKLDKAPYVEDLLKDPNVEWLDGEAPDGEYLVLTFPEEDVRIDFFSADYDVVRIVTSGEYENLFRVTYSEGLSIGERMRAWYGDLVAAQ